MPARTILKDRDSKPLIEELTKVPGMGQLSRKSRVEVEAVKNSEIIFVDGEAKAFKMEGQIIPVLTNGAVLERIPHVTVDMGAVPHVVGGADIMAPGIRGVTGSFAENDLVVIVDEKHGKSLAVGRALFASDKLATIRKGKAIINLHYVGDHVWETIKPLSSGHA